jgi:hypothetical protein
MDTEINTDSLSANFAIDQKKVTQTGGVFKPTFFFNFVQELGSQKIVQVYSLSDVYY